MKLRKVDEPDELGVGGRWEVCVCEDVGGQWLSARPTKPVWVDSPLCTQHLNYLPVIHHVITDPARWWFGIKGKFMSGGHSGPPHIAEGSWGGQASVLITVLLSRKSWGWSMMKKSLSGVLGLIKKKKIHHYLISCRTHTFKSFHNANSILLFPHTTNIFYCLFTTWIYISKLQRKNRHSFILQNACMKYSTNSST